MGITRKLLTRIFLSADNHSTINVRDVMKKRPRELRGPFAYFEIGYPNSFVSAWNEGGFEVRN